MYDLPPVKPYYSFVKANSFSLASIIKLPPAYNPDEISYSELVCTEEDRANIFELISTIANHNPIKLGFMASHLKELGAKIDHVHPLKFLGTIFGDPYLKDCMYDVMGRYFTRTHFLGGLKDKLDIEFQKKALEKYLLDFSNEVRVPPEEILKFFRSGEWEEMVRFLMEN